MPKPKDIGLIFDVTLENVDKEKKDLLKFRVRADGYCRVNATPDIVMRKMGRIIGGDFGFIEPGGAVNISLIWPTTSLYNRVGDCPISISSTNNKNQERTIKLIIKFDTRFEILDPDNCTLKKQKDFVDCQNWDKDYFRNCTPVNCEERYLGLRNFYNNITEKCEEAPQCLEKHELLDTGVMLSEEGSTGFNEDTFDNNMWDGKFKLEREPEEDANEKPWFPKDNAWLYGLGQGLLIVFVTIAIYILICFSIFLLVIWLSNKKGESKRHAIVFTPRLSEDAIPICTTSSYMSQR